MVQASSSSDAEPRPLRGEVVFEEGDFHSLSKALAGDPQYNDRRLVARQKILALGKKVVKETAALGCPLDCRTSLHHPHVFNGMRVRRIWAYLTRSRAEKRRLKGILGAELGRDLNAAYRNAYLCLAIEAEALEVSMRIHPDAWYDGQNLVNRVKREGMGRWLELLNALGGWRLQMHDWKGEWRCGDLSVERLEEYLSYYTPGDHRLSVAKRWPAPEGARGGALDPAVGPELVRTAVAMVPLYRYSVWSEESSFLFEG
jgi:hypothetical protein